MAPGFLDAMVAGAGASTAEVALWEGMLRDSFAALAPYPFLDPDKAEGAWKRCARSRATGGAAGRRALAGQAGRCSRAGGGALRWPAPTAERPATHLRRWPLTRSAAPAASPPARRLDVVTQSPSMKRCLAALLAREAVAAAGARGSDFQVGSDVHRSGVCSDVAGMHAGRQQPRRHVPARPPATPASPPARPPAPPARRAPCWRRCCACPLCPPARRTTWRRSPSPLRSASCS